MLEASKKANTSLLQPLFDYTDVAWGNLRGVLQRVTPPTEPCSSNYIMKEHLKWHFPCAYWLTLSSRRKMHKCILVFKCLSNLVAKYLTQYFTRNADLHNHATTCTRRNNLHPPKPKCNMGKLKIWWLLKYFNLQHSFNIISYSTHFLYWLSWIFIVLLLIFIMYIIDIKLSNLWIVYILFFISHGPYGYQSRCWMGYPG